MNQGRSTRANSATSSTEGAKQTRLFARCDTLEPYTVLRALYLQRQPRFSLTKWFGRSAGDDQSQLTGARCGGLLARRNYAIAAVFPSFPLDYPAAQ